MTGAGADFLQLSPAAAPARGLTSWLARAIRAAIMDGRLRAGASLPATRQLADDLGVSRGVIVEAYQRLADEGLVSARPGAGTRVSALPLPPAPSPPAPSPPTPSPPAPSRPAPSPSATSPPSPAASPTGLSPAARRPPRLAPSVLPQRWRTHAELDLSPGVPDLSGFPRAAWLRAERSVLDRASVADLGYGDPRGSQWLRDELAGWLARTRGLRATAEDVIIVSGVAQALALLAQWLYAEGRTPIAVEDPGSRGAHEELAYWGLRPVPVPVDDQGLRTGDLADRACAPSC
jgi:GntR family transcriptional regulator / MocR family aminotransferase